MVGNRKVFRNSSTEGLSIFEVKNPDRKDRANEYTPAQQEFMKEARWRNAPVFTWRTEEDVLKTLGVTND